MKQVCAWENYDAQTDTCSAPTWEPDSVGGLLPDLTPTDAIAIGVAVWGVLALAWAWRFLKKSV